MGFTLSATLAYGIFLGTEEDPNVGPRHPYGGLSEEWCNEHNLNDDDPVKTWEDVLEEAIVTASGFTDPEPEFWDPIAGERSDAWNAWSDRQTEAVKTFGVRLDYTGTSTYPGIVLIIEDTEESVAGSRVLHMDLARLNNMSRTGAGMLPAHDWDPRLKAVLEAAGLTLDEDYTPGWLVYASCDGHN